MKDNTKDKEMASRMRGSGNSRKVASNGVDKFTCLSNAEFRTTMRCPICHGVTGVTLLDAHLRLHMGGAAGES